MSKTKFLVMFIALLTLLSCSLAPARTPIDPTTKIALTIIDIPTTPLVTAHLLQQNNSLIISGEVHKRNTSSLNGYVFLSIIGPDGQQLWHKRAELTSSGLRLQRYRLFEEHDPSLPPTGSTVRIEFRNFDNHIDADLFKPDSRTSLTL